MEEIEANCLVRDERGWWVCLFDTDGDVVTLAGPWPTLAEAGEHLTQSA